MRHARRATDYYRLPTISRAARRAFLYMMGEWPEHEIDFIDHDNLNNR
jgi:hypothetical protein